MQHLCPICEKKMMDGETVVVISSPTRISNANKVLIDFDFAQSNTNEQMIHVECLRKTSSVLYQLVTGEISSSVEYKIDVENVEIDNSTMNTLWYTLNAADAEVSLAMVHKFMCMHPELKTVKEFTAQWFKERGNLT